MSACIDGSASRFYKSGIFNKACKQDNHAVIIVGYGIENGQKYYKIRNSWGPKWGKMDILQLPVTRTIKTPAF